MKEEIRDDQELINIYNKEILTTVVDVMNNYISNNDLIKLSDIIYYSRLKCQILFYKDIYPYKHYISTWTSYSGCFLEL
jgi:hypothetical protein